MKLYLDKMKHSLCGFSQYCNNVFCFCVSFFFSIISMGDHYQIWIGMAPKDANNECLIIRDWSYLRDFRRCGLISGSVSECDVWDLGSPSQPRELSLFLMSVNQDVELSASPVPCLSSCHHGRCHCNNELKLWTISKFQLNSFLHKCCHGDGASSKQKNAGNHHRL